MGVPQRVQGCGGGGERVVDRRWVGRHRVYCIDGMGIIRWVHGDGMDVIGARGGGVDVTGGGILLGAAIIKRGGWNVW